MSIIRVICFRIDLSLVVQSVQSAAGDTKPKKQKKVQKTFGKNNFKMLNLSGIFLFLVTMAPAVLHANSRTTLAYVNQDANPKSNDVFLYCFKKICFKI